MTGAIALAFAIFAVSAGSSVAAATRDDDYDSKEVREIQARFGDCVVKKRYETARQFVLATHLVGADQRKYVRQVADGRCLVAAASPPGGVEMKFPADTMRYALADALVKREFSGRALPSVSDAAPLPRPKIDEDAFTPKPGMKKALIEEWAAQRRKWQLVIYLAELGECVVRAEPVQGHSLLMTRPGSVEEVIAFKSLAPALGQCVIAGQQVKLNKVTLRGTIALNYYRLAHAPRQPTTPVGAPQ